MKRGVLIIFVAILIPCLLQAQTTPNDPQRLTLEQAVNFAVEHNKELQASQMNIELRNKMVTEAISQGLPQINGDLNYSTNFRYKMSFPGSESSTVLKDQSSVGVTVNQLLFSGEWILGIQTSKIAKLIASQQVDVTELDIKETVYNSYYNSDSRLPALAPSLPAIPRKNLPFLCPTRTRKQVYPVLPAPKIRHSIHVL